MNMVDAELVQSAIPGWILCKKGDDGGLVRFSLYFSLDGTFNQSGPLISVMSVSGGRLLVSLFNFNGKIDPLFDYDFIDDEWADSAAGVAEAVSRLTGERSK